MCMLTSWRQCDMRLFADGILRALAELRRNERSSPYLFGNGQVWVIIDGGRELLVWARGEYLPALMLTEPVVG